MQIDHLSRPAKRALATNANTSAFTIPAPTVTEPTSDGYVNLVEDGAVIPQFAKLWPIGLGADNDAFSMRVWGWHLVRSGTTKPLWFPMMLAEVSCTMCAATGVAGAAVLNTERFCDTITVVATVGQSKFTDADSGGAANRGTLDIYSPASDLIGHLILPLRGCQKLQFDFDQTTNNPTMNVLYSLL